MNLQIQKALNDEQLFKPIIGMSRKEFELLFEKICFSCYAKVL